jgi:phosphatidylglycerol:prolipoprotein diacylglycerol transferase
MIVLGGVLSFYFLYKRKSDAGLKNEDDFWLLVNTILIGGFLGGRLLYLVEYTRWFSPEFWRTLWSPGSGFSVLGSFVGVPASVWIFCRIRQVPFMRLMDVICVMAPLWHVFGRFGCLLAGCCHGRPTFANWGIVFRNPRSMVRPEWLGVPLYPTQILEAIGSALMAFYLYRLFQKSAGKPAGLVTAVYFASYGLLRCVMEYDMRDVSNCIFHK